MSIMILAILLALNIATLPAHLMSAEPTYGATHDRAFAFALASLPLAALSIIALAVFGAPAWLGITLIVAATLNLLAFFALAAYAPSGNG